MKRTRVVVITGASSGIGLATALRLARRGDRLVLTARGPGPLEAAAEQCRALGARVLVVPADVADADAVYAVADAAVAEFGRIDAWVSSAGVIAYGTFETLSPEAFRRVIEVNFFGQVNAARAALRAFRAEGRGTLVLVGSLYAAVSSPYLSSYVSSKHAVRGLARSLRQEMRGTGIQVSAVHPATIDTPIYANAAHVPDAQPHPMPPAVHPDRVARTIARALRHPRPEVYVGRVQRVLAPIHAGVPRVFDRVVPTIIRRVALRGSATPTDGNLYASGDDHAVTGGWRHRGLRVLAVAGAAVVAGRMLAERFSRG